LNALRAWLRREWKADRLLNLNRSTLAEIVNGITTVKPCEWCGGRREQLYGVSVCARCGVRLP
jgi:hypothetical protein